MSGFTIACILGKHSPSLSLTNNFKRKFSDENDEHQLHKRQTIEGNEIFNCLHILVSSN
jgi:hypothetical protein